MLRAVAASRRLRILLGQSSESRLLQGLATASRLQRLKRPHNWPLVLAAMDGSCCVLDVLARRQPIVLFEEGRRSE